MSGHVKEGSVFTSPVAPLYEGLNCVRIK